MAVDLCGTLSSPYRLDDEQTFRRLIEVWEATAPELLPTRAESDEPVRRAFDCGRLEEALPYWLNGVWFGRNPKIRMSVDVLTGRNHSTLSISIRRPDPGVIRRVDELFDRMASLLRPDYGFLHILTSSEVAEARAVGRPDLATLSRVTGEATIISGHTRQLQHGLPTLYWANLFGPPYVGLIGSDRLLAAPAASVSANGDGIRLQLTEGPPSEDAWNEFRDRRDAVISHLGRDIFWPNATRIPSAMNDFDPSPLPRTPG